MISEEKTQIVINNYFKSECSVDTSIRQAFEKGFRIGLKKGLSAQPEPQWIPCSERLPNGQTEVIVSCCDDSGDSKYNYTSFGWMTRDGEYWIVDNEINYYVNAWMPLPEPWKGAER